MAALTADVALRLELIVAFADNPDADVAASLHRGLVAAFAAEQLCAPLDLTDLRWPQPTRTLSATIGTLATDVMLFGADVAGMRRATIGVRFVWAFDRDDTFLARVSRAVRAAIRDLPAGATSGMSSLVVETPAISVIAPPASGSSAGAVLQVYDHRGARPIAMPIGFFDMLPPPARREVADEVELITWAHDPIDSAELVRGAHAQQRWAAAKLELELPSNGDVRGPDTRLPGSLVCQLVVTFDEAIAIDKRIEVVRDVLAVLEQHEVAPALPDDPGLHWPQRRWFVRGSAPRDVELSVWCEDREAHIYLAWPWPEQQALIAKLVATVLAVHAALPAGAALFPTSVVPRDLDLASVRPPRELADWSYGSLLDIVDVEHPWASRPPDGFNEALPAPAQRHVQGTLHLSQWATDPLTRDELQRALAMQQRWLAQRLEAPVIEDERWNEQGDRRVDAELEPRPPLTLYDAVSAAGYKTLIVARDGSVPDRDLLPLAELIRAHELPDGSPLTSLTIVCSTRSAALALEPRARSLGLRVAYAAGQGEIWDPRPEGWLDPE